MEKEPIFCYRSIQDDYSQNFKMKTITHKRFLTSGYFLTREAAEKDFQEKYKLASEQFEVFKEKLNILRNNYNTTIDYEIIGDTHCLMTCLYAEMDFLGYKFKFRLDI